MSTQNAYVTFLIRNDSYLPGALLLAHELKKYTLCDTVCLVTEAVSYAIRWALEMVYDRVIPIQEVYCKSHLIDGRCDRNSLMTRFSALRLGSDGDLGQKYERILLLDADVLPLDSMDVLFGLSSPAGIIMERKEYCVAYNRDGSLTRSADKDGEWCWHKHYRTVPHGALLPREFTDRVLLDPGNMGINSGLWLLHPSMTELEQLTEQLRKPEILELVTRRFPWPEMQFATLCWSGRWTNIDIRYCSIGGYPDLQLLKGVHFAGLKPWQIHNRSIAHYRQYPDFQLWYACYLSLIQSCPQLLRIPMLKRIGDFILWR